MRQSTSDLAPSLAAADAAIRQARKEIDFGADTTDAERFPAGHIRRTRLALAQHPELFPADPVS
ncbi:hypothetical protein ACWEQ7_21225 [Streptomyces sp. NPDC004069]